MTENLKEKTLPKEIKEQKEKEKWKTWKITTLLGIIVATLDVIIIVVGVHLRNNLDINLGWTVAAVGIVTFFGMLIVSSYHKKDSPEGDKGTMRDALTASLVSAYFAVVAYSMFENVHSDNTILSSFSSVIMIVIGFYFGTKGAIEIYKHKAAIAKSQKPKSE